MQKSYTSIGTDSNTPPHLRRTDAQIKQTMKAITDNGTTPRNGIYATVRIGIRNFLYSHNPVLTIGNCSLATSTSNGFHTCPVNAHQALKACPMSTVTVPQNAFAKLSHPGK